MTQKEFRMMKVKALLAHSPERVIDKIALVLQDTMETYGPKIADMFMEVMMLVAITGHAPENVRNELGAAARQIDNEHDCAACEATNCPRRTEPMTAEPVSEGEANEEKTTPVPAWLKGLDLNLN